MKSKIHLMKKHQKYPKKMKKMIKKQKIKK